MCLTSSCEMVSSSQKVFSFKRNLVPTPPLFSSPFFSGYPRNKSNHSLFARYVPYVECVERPLFRFPSFFDSSLSFSPGKAVQFHSSPVLVLSDARLIRGFPDLGLLSRPFILIKCAVRTSHNPLPPCRHSQIYPSGSDLYGIPFLSFSAFPPPPIPILKSPRFLLSPVHAR